MAESCEATRGSKRHIRGQAHRHTKSQPNLLPVHRLALTASANMAADRPSDDLQACACTGWYQVKETQRNGCTTHRDCEPRSWQASGFIAGWLLSRASGPDCRVKQ